ncbi:MAG: shikimate dehydrogenase [Sphingobacteriales bacterium]|nr:MAG: shikimate dehydrogenase [Sphingobacteriales bacterium]
MQKIFGLIGSYLGHSFSPGYFNSRFHAAGIDAIYKTFEIPSISEFPKLLQDNPGICGLNVTIPYKKAVIPYLDTMDYHASQIGAVNCIQVSESGLKGYNTDWLGFGKSISSRLRPQHSKALILGNGGAAPAVRYWLDQHRIKSLTVTRTPQEETLLFEDLRPEVLAEYKIIINTTPLGMSPEVQGFPPIPYEAINASHLLFDLIYNPAKTIFLREGENRGATVLNGLEMLHAQAEASWIIWNS